MPRQQELFGARPRKAPRIMMKVADAGVGERGLIVNLVCPRCGHDDGWWEASSVTDANRGAPCPKCNKERK